MPITQYEEIHKSKIEYQIHERYKTEIQELSRLGFADLHFTREVTFPLSALLMFWAYFPMKANGEIFVVEKPLRFVLLNPLMLNTEYDSYVNIFGMGVKFLTLFQDKGVLISCNYQSKEYINPKKGIFRYAEISSIANCWQKHQCRVEGLEQQGFISDEELSLAKFEAAVAYDDKVLLSPF